MPDKPASRRITKALRWGDQFVAQFALPGLVPSFVEEGGRTLKFDTVEAAEAAATQAVLRLYDMRTIDTRKAGGYRRLTGSEIAILISDLGITPTYFAEIAGVPQSRVMKWIDGEQDVPHSVHVLIRLMIADPTNQALAEKITRESQEVQ